MRQEAQQPPAFPLDLTAYLPAGLGSTLSLAETGAFMRLLAFSWRQQPPCSLPDDTAVLAAVVGIKTEQWPRLSRLAPAFTMGPDGRIHLREAAAVYARLAAEAERAARTSAVRAQAARARWSQDPPDANASDANALQMHPRNHAIASTAPSLRSERSALQRSSLESKSVRSLGAQSAEVIARIGSAGARALVEDKLKTWRQSHSLGQLRAFVEELRQSGRSNVPLAKADELARGQWSTPDRIDAAICRIKDRMAVGDCQKPLGFLISLLGMSARGRATLIEVPLPIAAKWDALEARVAEQAAVFAATAARLEEHRQRISTPAAGVPRAISGA